MNKNCNRLAIVILTMASIALVMVASHPRAAYGQVFGSNLIQTVGGVRIDTQGVLTDARQQLPDHLRQELLRSSVAADGQLNEGTSLRVLSLRGLEATLREAVEQGTTLPNEVLYMAGLQRISFVLVDPDSNDVLIGGPAEGWTVDTMGNIVGETTRMPVLRLEDFLVAMRTTEAARTDQGISVSIEPTEEGTRRYRNMLQSIQSFDPSMTPALEQAMGQQQVLLTGVPTDSRYAQVLVAADYRMKRLSMGFDAAPVDGMPSVLELARQRGANFRNSSPRFWMECHYEPIAHSPDRKTWQISGQGVRALTEEELIDSQGQRRSANRVNAVAKRWADSMTENFEQLAERDPIMAELRNLMDMSVAAALIEKEGLLQAAGLDLPIILDREPTQPVSTPRWQAPQSVPTQSSFVRINRGWIVTASGGVQVDSFGVLEQLEENPQLADIHRSALAAGGSSWWWNASR